MQGQQIKQEMQSIAGQAIPPETNLWPAMRLRAQQLSNRRHSHAMRARLARRALAGVTVALALVSGLLLAVPSARAAVGGVLQQFGLVFIDMSNVPVATIEWKPEATVDAPAGVEVLSVVTSTTDLTSTLPTPKKWNLEEARTLAPFPTRTPTWLPSGFAFDGVMITGLISSPSAPKKWNLEEARTLVPFPIRTPTWLPDGFAFDGIMFTGLYTGTDLNMPPQVAEASLYYTQTEQSADWATQNLALHISKPAESGQLVFGYMAPRGHTRQMKVNGQAALYVSGGYELDEMTRTMQWNENKRAGVLAWELGGVNYLLSYNDLDISLEDLMRIAESIQ